MEELRNIEAVISRHSDQVDANKNFEVKVMVAKKLKVPVDIKAAMNCRKCEITCHYPCDPFWAKECCEAFSTRGFGGYFAFNVFGQGSSCEVCPGKCGSWDHQHEETRWVNKQVEETKTFNDIREKFKDANKKKLSAEEMIFCLLAEVDVLENSINQDVGELTGCLNELRAISMCGDALTSPDYMKLLIENEKRNKKEGYMEKIKSLEDLLKKVVLADKIRLGAPVA